MNRFDDDRYYTTSDAELELLGTPAALAKQRSRGEGPRYHKVGKRVLYLGRDLNEFLDSCVIEPACHRDGSAGLRATSGPRGSTVGQAGEFSASPA